jgi:hypothetical protein
MSLTLDDDDMAALRQALDSYLPELRYELARIKLERDRRPLVDVEEKLTNIRKRLGV